MNSEKTIDCQGLPCPQPVLRCKETIERDQPRKISALVDNDPGTCLDFFGLMEKKKTGQTTNMLDIISGMSMADKVVTL